MTKLLAILGLGGLAMTSPALANHIFNAGPYPSRGACESAMAELSNGDREWLQAAYPQLFSSTGEVSSFLTRAFQCEYDDVDRQWYIIDHRREVVGSEWFQRRLR